MRGLLCASLIGLGLAAQAPLATPAAADVSIVIGVPVYAPPPHYYHPPPPRYVVVPPPYWYAPPPRYVAVPVYPRYYYAPPHHRGHKHKDRRW